MSTKPTTPKRWTYGDACTRLRELEGQKSLFDRHRCQGWSIWSLVRPVLVSRMCQINRELTRVKREASNCLAIGLDGLRLLTGGRKIQGAAIIVTHSSEWRIPTPGGIDNIYFGSIAGDRSKYACVEMINRDSALRDRTSRAWEVSGSFEFWKMMACLLMMNPFRKNRYRARATALKADLAELEESFGRELISENEVEEIMRKFDAQFRVYRWLLGRLRPRAIGLSVYYGKEALIAAAQSRGTPVIELQHGSIYDGHYAYSYDPEHLKGCPNVPFPDVFCAYGKYWLDAMNGLGYWQAKQVKLCGAIEIDRIRAQRSPGPPDVACEVVITTQGVYEEELTKFLRGVFRELEGCWSFIIRSHPLLDDVHLQKWVETVRSEFPDIQARLSSGATSRRTTNEILLAAKWHASISSTCHVEALGIGVPTIVIPLPTSENLRSLRGRSGAFFPANPKEMAQILLHAGSDISDVDSTYYFEDDALTNLTTVLEESSR